jgi:predicted metal-dependent hydrolase
VHADNAAGRPDPGALAPAEPDRLVLQPRDVQFEWSGLPLRWIPGEPLASHVINVLHLLLPEGERWFVRTFRQALPLIHDEELREDVLGFIGQEALHAEAHQGVLDYFAVHGLDPQPYVRHMEWLFRRILGDRPSASPAVAHRHLVERVAIIAAIEHFTAFLGDWILNAPALDRAKANPQMLDLLRWHGAEEVEHRSVAYDLLQYLDPGYPRRVRAMALAGPVLVYLWARGARYLITSDTEFGPRATAGWRGVAAAARRGVLPTPGRALRSGLRYLRRGYHPTQEGSTRQAVAYLGSSPAARAAAH